MVSQILSVQVYHNGTWFDAAEVEFHDPDAGINGRTTFAYNDVYFFDHGAVELANNAPVFDHRAVSVTHPLDLTMTQLDHWPPFLLDLMPQGHARDGLIAQMELRPDDPRADIQLLLNGASNPIGNIRIREAHELEKAQIEQVRDIRDQYGCREYDVFEQTDQFMETAEVFAQIASGTSGVQGEWPKIVMARDANDMWYPDALVADDESQEHVIFKMVRSTREEDRLILKNEAPYLELARKFGLRVGSTLGYSGRVLKIPRFDRTRDPHGLIRAGQESLVAASGQASFAYNTSHFEYLDVILKYCTDPKTEIIEYVLRDVLNLAMGNTDNHGRNTALQKFGNWIGLTPLYDFAPMALLERNAPRPTRWPRDLTVDYNPDWKLVGEEIENRTNGILPKIELLEILTGKIEFLRELEECAEFQGVDPDVIAGCFNRCADVMENLRKVG